jgi:hypothetical protein
MGKNDFSVRLFCGGIVVLVVTYFSSMNSCQVSDASLSASMLIRDGVLLCVSFP